MVGIIFFYIAGVVDTCGISNSLRKYDKDHGEDEVFMVRNKISINK